MKRNGRLIGFAAAGPAFLAILLLVAPDAARAQIVNGSFEEATGGGAGGYAGWTLVETDPAGSAFVTSGTFGVVADGQSVNHGDELWDWADGLFVTQLGLVPDRLPITFTATDGGFVAIQLQRGAQRHRMFQDIHIPDGATDLTWDMGYRNWLGAHDDAYQYLAVHVRDLDDTILETLFKTVAGVPIATTAMTAFTADISSYAGQDVRLDIELQNQVHLFDVAWDNFAIQGDDSGEVPPPPGQITLDMDIKPDSDTNPVNLKTKGLLTVAILSGGGFDAPTRIDASTVVFGPNWIAPAHGGHTGDLDGDGDLDVLFHFSVEDAGLNADEPVVCLAGLDHDGVAMIGCDEITIVGKGK
jgi:hypothetical protein